MAATSSSSLRLAPATILLFGALFVQACDAAAQGGIPDPSASTVPDCLPICPAEDRPFQVVVRDIKGVPVGMALVRIRLRTQLCPNSTIAFCPNCPDAPAYDAGTQTITRMTDVYGSATFLLCGSISCVDPQWVEVSANNVALRFTTFATTDLDGDLDVDAQDVSLSAAAVGSDLPQADQDCSQIVDADDTAIVSAHVGHACPPAAPSTILITEVEADPVQPQLDYAWQWFELRNATGQTRTLTNWTVANEHASDVLPSITLGPGACVVVAADSSNFRASHPGYAGMLVGVGGSIGLGRTSGLLVLRDETATEVDCVSWGTNTTCLNPPLPSPAANTVATLQRISIVDSDGASDWAEATETPCTGIVGAPDSPATEGATLAIAPNPAFARTTISCAGVAAGPVVVAIHDVAGRRIRTLRDEGSGSSRSLPWNGLDEEGRTVPSGVYLVKLQSQPGAPVFGRLLLLR